MSSRIVFITFISIICFSFTQIKAPNFTVAFYNVENLFDTVDDPDTQDDWFTPDGKNKWTTERYDKKIADLSKVLNAMGTPTLIGLCEVENEKVCRDLVAHENLSGGNYGVAHKESPDFRGIDNALLYQKDKFEIEEIKGIRINFPPEIVEDYTTRDILYVRGKVMKKHRLHVFVNHWPSRRDGMEESEPKRLYVAEQLKKAVDNILSEDSKARIIIMGDFNDEPDNNSVSKTLDIKMDAKIAKKGGMYNCMSSANAAEQGTYNFRGNWNLLDQFMVSSFLLKRMSKFRISEPKIFRQEWMMYNSERYGATPNRTYGGPNYYGGISDHLPILLEFTVR